MRVTDARWWAALLPAVAIILVDYARHQFMARWTHPWEDTAALLVGVLVITFVTSQLLFNRIDRSERRQQQSEGLRQVGAEVTATLELDKILASILSRGREVLAADCLGIALPAHPGWDLVVQAGDLPGPRRLRLETAEDPLQEAAASGEAREIHRDGKSSAHGGCATGCRRCLTLPLRMGPQTLGVLCAGSRREGPWSPDGRRLADQVASIASASIANALLHRRSRDLATLEERDRIAREMHDSLAQVLGYLGMRTALARESLARRDLARLETELAEIGQVADDAYQDVREAILGLRESVRASRGLADALQDYLRKFSRQSGIPAHVVAPEGTPLDLPPGVEIQLLRVIQEALSNVRKHARARHAVVRLEERDGELCVAVEDDGTGFDPTVLEARRGDGFGIASMDERLRGIGGRLAIESVRGRGTTVRALVPLAAKEEVASGHG